MTAIVDRRENGIRTRHRPAVPGAPFIPDLERAVAGGVATLDEVSVLVPDNQLATGAAAAGKALMGDRTWGDVATQAELDAEAATRAAADTTLQTNITAEATTRAAADTAESAARIAGDALALQKASNLSDVANVATSRTNLGLGALAVKSTIATGDIDADAVTYPKIQNVSATDKVLGRSTAGAGDIEEIVCTAAGRALIDDANAAAQRTTLGLGAVALLASIATGNIDNDAVTYAKIQNVSATDKLLGRSTAGAGDVEEIACTAAARSLLDDATIADILTTLGTVAVSVGTFTPTWTPAAGSGATISVATGFYIKIGKWVLFSLKLATNGHGTSSGAVTIGGLPVAASADANSNAGGLCIQASNMAITAGQNVTLLVNIGATTANPYTWNATTGTAITTCAEWGVSGSLNFVGLYRTDT